MLDFYRTIGGRQLIDGTLPRIAKALERIAASLEQAQADPVIELLAEDPRVREYLDADRHPQYGDKPASPEAWRKLVIAAYKQGAK